MHVSHLSGCNSHESHDDSRFRKIYDHVPRYDASSPSRVIRHCHQAERTTLVFRARNASTAVAAASKARAQ